MIRGARLLWRDMLDANALNSAPESTSASMNTARIAIVDDHSLFASGLAAIVTAHDGWEVVWSGPDVGSLLTSGVIADVVLLDIDLAGEAVSSAAVSALRARGMLVLVVSALTYPRAVQRLAASDVEGFVSKSDDPAKLSEAIAAVLEGDGWITPRAMRILSERANDARVAPRLSPQERRVVELYASGMKIASVARALEISPHTVSSYLKAAREKFAHANRSAPTQRDLYRHARELGIVDS